MFMLQPLVSIIIPVYNQAKELRLALESIKNQTYKNIEVIVVDDGSEQPITYNLKPITYNLIRQDNCGAPSARNKGLELAKGEYVIFWDADIVGVPRMLEVMKKGLDENPEAIFAYSSYKIQVTSYKIQKNIKSQIFNVQKLRENNYIHSTSLIRKKDAIKWDESLKRFQDWDLWLTMAEENKKGIWIDEYLFTIIAKGSISSWLPRLAYKKPWKYLPGIRNEVEKYEGAMEIIKLKHGI